MWMPSAITWDNKTTKGREDVISFIVSFVTQGEMAAFLKEDKGPKI